MNNQQFRRLLVDTPKQQSPDGASNKTAAARTPSTVLGARKHSSIPMTPRQVGRTSTVQADFARQLAERNAKAHPQKKFRSAAPKGTKLAAGYTDRSKDRADEEENEIAKRIKNLEEAMKAGQIDRETFEKLVQEIAGGDIGATHLVKGLDRKLLERVRKGEDVLGGKGADAEGEKEQTGVEDEFDELAEQEVGPVVREKVEKKGTMAPPPPVAGVKRSRNDILAELKRQREEAAAAAAAEHEKKYPSLGTGFRKVNGKGETSRIEVDAKGREVLIITDAQGKEKRKVRKQKAEEPHQEIRHDIDDEKKPINMHNLPPPKTEESEDEDIFEGVGSNYNPLANLDDGDDSSSDEDGEAKPESEQRDLTPPPKHSVSDSGPEPLSSTRDTKPPPTKRDYFARASHTLPSKDTSSTSSLSTADATVRAALLKVRTLDPSSTLLTDPTSEEARLAKRAAQLAAADRDMEDIDMGFGGSRFDDAEDMEREGEKVKFSEWKGLGGGDEDGEDEGGERGGAKKRKRGPKKRKGDKNSASDVLKAMERQKEKTLG